MVWIATSYFLAFLKSFCFNSCLSVGFLSKSKLCVEKLGMKQKGHVVCFRSSLVIENILKDSV